MCDKCIYQKYIDKIEKMIATGNYNNVIDFLIVAFAIFMVVRGINALKKKEKA